MVLAPLLVPMAVAFGVHPIHLGVIFLANLELGYLTPAGGPEPLPRRLALRQAAHHGRAHACCPFLLIMAVAVLLITYVPQMSVGVLRALGRL